MLFATTSLAARIDRAECQVTVDFGTLARRRDPGVLLQPIGGATAVFAGPDQPFSKLVGLGFDRPIDEEALDRVEQEYDRRGAALRVELATVAGHGVAPLLTSRGYRLIGFENVLGLELTSDVVARLHEERSPEIDVTRVEPQDVRTWIRVVTDAFAHPDAFDGPPPTETFDAAVIERVFGDVAAIPSMSMYLARRSGEIAGGGAVRLLDGLAMLSGAATLPAHRRRGVQSTLLRRRLVDAARSGCDLAVVTTEPASKSQENVQKAGFALLYSRAVLVRAPKGDSPPSGVALRWDPVANDTTVPEPPQELSHGTILRWRRVPGLVLGEVEYAPNQRVPAHDHANARFVLVLRGRITEIRGAESLTHASRTLLYRQPRERHAYQIGPAGATCLIVDMDPAWLQRAAGEAPVLTESTELTGGLVLHLAQRLHGEFGLRDDVSRLAIESLALGILAEASRRVAAEAEREAPVWVRDARAFVDANFAERLAIATVAALVGVHPVHLARTFKRVYNTTFAAYVRTTRLEFAKDELRRTTTPLSEIAVAAGFCDQSHFSRLFKAHTGLTPHEYRLAAAR